jgi:ABC-type sugar transport system ATPase subunit
MFDGVTAVDDVTLDIADREFMVLLGPSGCGKSTLLRMIAGLESPTSGVVSIGGVAVNDVEPKERDVAMVFQSYALYPHKTVRANIEFPLKVRKVPKAERAAAAEQAAAALGLTDYLGRKPGQLSGGQRQPSPGPSCASRPCSAWTNRSATSTPNCAARRVPNSWRCTAASAARSCTSPTTRSRR